MSTYSDNGELTLLAVGRIYFFSYLTSVNAIYLRT